MQQNPARIQEFLSRSWVLYLNTLKLETIELFAR